MAISHELKDFAEGIGLDMVRITSAEPLAEASERIRQQIRDGFRPKWNVEEIDAYCSPQSFLSDAKSVIVAAECYLTSEPANVGKPGEPVGKIARYTWRNYYYDVRTKLQTVADFLKKKVGVGFRFRCYSNGPLAEKPLANRAGIGWYGKHGIIMNGQYGSWIVLGELLTNLKLEEDEPVEAQCGSCQACIEACPTRAIVKPGVLDESKCLQKLTHSQMVMPNHVRELWEDRLYGCMSCQEICPINQKVKPKEKKPEYGYIGSSLPLLPILKMSEREYRERYCKNQIGEWWVSFSAIQRNALVALGNIGDSAAVPALAETLEKSRSMIVKMHAAWALGKVGGQEAKNALEKALKRKLSPEIQREVTKAIKRIK